MATDIEIKDAPTTDQPAADDAPSLSPQQRAAKTRAQNAKADKVIVLDEQKAKAGDPDAVISTEVSATNHDDQLSGKKVRVEFFDQKEDGGSDAIFASLNGYAYQIPRGVVVDIPVELLQVFHDAKSAIVETVPGGGSRTRTVNRFNFSILQ